MVCLGSGRRQEDRSDTAGEQRASKARLVVHGGSGQFTPDDYPPETIVQHRRGMSEALHAGNEVLRKGGSALDAVVAAVVALENNPLFNAGRGAVFNIAGKHELEASIAVSRPPAGTDVPGSRKGAAVTLLKTVKNPILLAKELYLDPIKCPHAFVSGQDAERIAIESGLEVVDEHYFDTEQRWDEHKRGLKLLNPFGDDERDLSEKELKEKLLRFPQGTVGAVALDEHGMLACATSTGGKTNKNIGRIGDSPSFGSGFYCSTWPSTTSQKLNLWTAILQRVRGSASQAENGVAISGTGDGDYFLRNCAAYDVVARMKYLGQSVGEASKEVVNHLKEQEGIGGLIAVDLHGNFAMPLNSTGMFRGTITPFENIPRIAMWSDEKLSPEPRTR